MKQDEQKRKTIVIDSYKNATAKQADLFLCESGNRWCSRLWSHALSRKK